VLDVGLAGFWLYETVTVEPDGAPTAMWRRYEAGDFYRISLENDRDVPR
jgi:hypothetical protein